ncbi:MAG TPA: sugar ABC transporter substrate-binding protein [Chloroflexota bacterium]|nr:sugar ABC transporter substrate-binding protein [Chloroflexota bacterium]
MAEAVTITFMNRGGPEAFAVHDKVIAAFAPVAPRVTVKTEPLTEGSWQQKLTTQLASGTAPDTLMTSFGGFAPFAKRGDILDLDRFLTRDRDVRPADWYPLALDSLKYQGKLVNMPYNGGTYALFFNRELFDAAQLRPPDDTWTWDRYVEAAAQLTADSSGRRSTAAGFDGDNVARYGAHNVQSDPGWHYWVWTYGGELLSRDGRAATFRDPKVLDAIQWIADANKRRLWPSPLARDAQPVDFRRGNVAMTTWGHWQVARVRTDPLKWDVAPMPRTRDGKRIALGWYSGNAIVRGTKQPDAAWEFLKFFGGAAGQRILGLEGLTLPAVRKVAESDEIIKTAPPENQRAFLADVASARIRYDGQVTETGEWGDLLNPELNKIWAGQASARDVLPPLVPRLNEILARN